MSSPSLVASFHALALALQPHVDSARSGVTWGNTISIPLNGVHQPHIESIRISGLFSTHLNVLERLMRGEEVQLTELSNLHSRLLYVEKLLQQVQLADQPNFQNGFAPDRRLQRMTGPVGASILPPSIRSERVEAPVNYPTRGENREITVTFVDIVGFSPLGEELSHDEVFPVLNDVLERLEEAVESEGGEVPGNWGDALLAIYGLRRGENHARSAVRAALKMEKVLEDWNAHIRHSHVRELRIRSGTHTGEAAVGYLGGKRRKVRTVIGRTVNIGARLEPLAFFEISETKKEYGILVSDSTLRSSGLRVFVHEHIGLKKLKGIAEERDTYRILREAPPSLVPRGADQTSFIGRHRELASLSSAFSVVQSASSAKLMIVRADAGEGKSRLGDKFIEGLGKDVTLVIAQGENRETVFPYEGIATAIRALASIDPGDDVQRARNKVKYVTQSAAAGDQDASQDLERRLPYLWKLLNIEDPNDRQLKDAEVKESEVWEQVLQSVEALFLQLTHHHPLALVLEDFHWMDPGSVSVIDRILKRLHDRPFFCLALSRPHFVGEYLARKVDEILPQVATESERSKRDATLLRLVEYFSKASIAGPVSESNLRKIIDEIVPPVTTGAEYGKRETSVFQLVEALRWIQVISLEPLSDEQLHNLVSEILPEAEEKVVAQLIELSGGNPYLITEMSSAIKRGMIIEKDETTKAWHFATSDRGVMKSVPLPSGALGFMQAKIDLIEPAHQEVLRLAAVIGAEFSIGDLVGLAKEILANDVGGALMSEEVGDTLMQDPEALLSMLVDLKVLLTVDQEPGKYQFPHALLRESAYEQSWKNTRSDVHLAMARYLKSSRPTELASIASHLAGGQHREEASRYYYQASEKGCQADPEGSIEYYRKGYEQATEPSLKMRNLRGWDEALYMSGKYAEQEKIYQLSLPLLERLPLIDRAGAHYRRARAFNKSFRFEEAIEEMQEALRIISTLSPQTPSERTEMLKLKASALLQIGLTYGEIGRAEDALRVYQEGYEAAEEARDFLNMGRGLWGLVDGSNKKGRYAGVLGRARLAHESLLAIKDRRRCIGLLAEWSRSYLQLGDFKNAELTLRKAQESAKELRGHASSVGEITPLLGRTLTYMGRNSEAITVLRSFQTPDKYNTLFKLVYLSFAYLSDNQPKAAMEEAEKAVELATEIKNPSNLAAAKMIIAQVLMSEGKVSEAHAASRVALGLYDEGKVTADLDLEILYTDALILDRMGQSEEAWDQISKAKDILKQRWSTIDADEDRVNFLGQIKAHRDIVKLWQTLQVSRSAESGKRGEMREYLAQLDFYASASVPNGLDEIASGAFQKLGDIRTNENHEITHHSRSHEAAEVGAVLLDSPLATVFNFLSSSEIELDVNPGGIEEFRAEGIKFKLLRDRDKALWGVADWRIGSSLLKGKLALALSRRGKMREILEGDITSIDGAIVIELKRSQKDKFVSQSGEVIGFEKKTRRPKEEEFGTLRFTFVPRGVDQTGVIMEMGKALYSRNVGNFLAAFLKAFRVYQGR